MWANTQKTSTGVEPAPRDLKGLSGRSKNGTRAITWHVVSSLYTHGLGRSSQIWRLFTCGVILASGCNSQEINLPVRVPSLTPNCLSKLHRMHLSQIHAAMFPHDAPCKPARNGCVFGHHMHARHPLPRPFIKISEEERKQGVILVGAPGKYQAQVRGRVPKSI